MFAETQYDLRFSVFGIPVRVHPAFWVMGAIMGYSPGWAEILGINVLAVILLWWAVIFVSILIHELGHALAAEYFGWPARILLYHFGGLAYYQPTRGQSPQKNILISLAGPVAGFVFYGVICVFEYFALQNGWFRGNAIAQYLLMQLKFVNLGWGLMNLLPVLPLDGGRICEEVLLLQHVRQPAVLCRKIGIATGCIVAALFLLPIPTETLGNLFGPDLAIRMIDFGIGTQANRYIGFLFGFLAVNNYQSLQGR